MIALISFLLLSPLTAHEPTIFASDLLKPLNPQNSWHFSGSYLAHQALSTNQADIIIAANTTQTPPDTQSIPFATMTTFVTAHKDNPINSLTIKELAEILGPSRQFKWRKYTPEDSFQNASILPFVSSLYLSIPILKKFCLKHQNFNPHVNLSPNEEDLVKHIQKNPNAIAFLTKEHPNLKTIKIEEKLPSDSTYPLKLNFNIFFKKENAQKFSQNLSQLQSPQFLQKLQDCGMLPEANPSPSSSDQALAISSGNALRNSEKIRSTSG